MDERMIQAAQTGDINLLYELILNDPYVLQRIDDVPFFLTPLHVAASAGHIEFMMEMINLKPSFARKLNQAGFSPLHLALQNNRTQAVLQLLKFDNGLVRVKGREGFTPLHHVIQTGDVDLLIKFLKVCPEAIEDVTVRNETVFHLAVKSDMFEAFQVLVGWLIRSRHESAQRWENELLSWADIDGNTVLHIAAIRNRPRVVKVLLGHLRRDQINAKNLEGLTALDIQSQYPWNERQADRIIDMLSKAGGLSASSPSLPNTSFTSIYIKSLIDKMSWHQKWETRAGRGMKCMPHKMRNTFLVVTVLIITSTFEASLNPPNKPDNSSSMKYQVSLSQDQPPLNSHTFWHKTNFNTAPIPSPSAMDVSKKDYGTSEYSLFWFYNTLTFWAALFLTAILLPSHNLFSSLILLILLSFGISFINLFEVSSWSWKHSYEFSKKNAHILFDVTSFFNFVFLFMLLFLIPSQLLFDFATLLNINKTYFISLPLIVYSSIVLFTGFL